MGKKTPSNGNGKPYKVALIIAQGGLGDQSYNDLAYAGLQAAAKDYTNLTVQPIQSSDIVGQGASILQQAASNKFDLVINLEFSLSDALNQVAPKFPDTQFGMINLEVKQPNITSVLFQEQEGSFLAGALAAMVTKDTSIKGINSDKIIGAIGGTKSTGIDKFLVGYQQGAQYVDKDTQVLVSYANSFGDPAKGKELTDAQYSKGADIVYQVAGGTGTGVIQSAKAAGKFAIGVDTDQDFLAQGNVLTSMVKRADLSVYDLCKDLATGQLKGGSTRFYGLQNIGVTLSPMKYTKQLIPADYLTKIEAIKQDIISGKLKVWNVIDQGYPDWFPK
jgi:basic membrane protein A